MLKTWPIANQATIKKGWSALVRSLGIEKATQFIVGLERGKGDSVAELKAIWKGKSARSIHREILEAKAKGKLRD